MEKCKEAVKLHRNLYRYYILTCKTVIKNTSGEVLYILLERPAHGS
jgi:hypothetical protein